MSFSREGRNKTGSEIKNRNGDSSVSEKVKEIKKRQENWMKQRKHQTTLADGEKVRENGNHAAIKSDILDFDEDRNSNMRRDSPKTETSDIKNKFKDWLEKSSKLNTVTCTTQSVSNIPPDDRYDSDDLENLKEKLLSTKDFDAKADSIVNKVRKDLNIDSFVSENEPLNRSQSCFENCHHDKRLATSNNLSSHHCPVCFHSMGTSDHMPMLLIPCGHSVCRLCSEGSHFCSVCNCDVNSVTCNIMLQQIIQEYNDQLCKPTPSSYNRRHSAKAISQYSADRYDSLQIQHKETHHRKYQEQLNNLETRMEIMMSEQTSVQEDVNDVENKIAADQKQLNNVLKHKQDIKIKISDLECKLQVLKHHEDDYREKCNFLKVERGQLSEKMSMLENTLTSLSQEVEKVHFLMESEEDM